MSPALAGFFRGFSPRRLRREGVLQLVSVEHQGHELDLAGGGAAGLLAELAQKLVDAGVDLHLQLVFPAFRGLRGHVSVLRRLDLSCTFSYTRDESVQPPRDTGPSAGPT